MKVVVTGAQGQVGRALAATVPAGAEVIALDRTVLDLTDSGALEQMLFETRPTHIINAAAWTAVDQAEAHESSAMAVNAHAVATLAAVAQDIGAHLVQISTDFVFAGDRGSPYPVDAVPSPKSAYGRTKFEGERAAGTHALIVRTAWVYGSSGGNFVRTMLRLMQERPEVRVVADQVGTPTFATGLADALWSLAARQVRGTLHYTDSGVSSWYDFAVAIQEEALAIGMLSRAIPVVPIATADFPTPARRPAYSVLDKAATWALLGAPAPHWRSQLRLMLQEISRNG